MSKQVITTEKFPIYNWATDLEDSALEQAKNLANLPFIHHHVALAPDCHLGYGMPIGGIIATQGVIIPNGIGVDIGCGMVALKTNIKHSDLDIKTLKKILGEMRKEIPVGFNHHKNPVDILDMPILPLEADENNNYIIKQEFEKARYSLGTAGGGNHFLEIQKDNNGYIWIMIHSGSRNLGLKVANHYNNIAKIYNKKWYSSVPDKHDLAFLPLDTQYALDYILEMNYCVEFAYASRRYMMNKVIDIFHGHAFPLIRDIDMINIAHNYAKLEHHYGKNVYVHRKGATSAYKDEIGIIPGSQGTKSYIVKGLGNCESFKSCSHGAGRTMGRKQAQRELNLEIEKKNLDDQGIIHSIRNISDLDEAPSAYKDIDIVMQNQADLVEIIVELTPLAVMKG